MEKNEFLKEVNEFSKDFKKLTKRAGKLKNEFGMIGKAYFAEVEHKAHEVNDHLNELLQQLKPSNFLNQYKPKNKGK